MRKITMLFIWLHTGVFAQTYITNVTLADVENHKMVANKTVVIKDGLISDVLPSGGKLPANATVIDGRGKFLLPGLVDSHIHFFQSGGLYTRPDAIDLRKHKPYEFECAQNKNAMPDVLKRYLKNGITTVIDPGATIGLLKKRQEFASTDFAPTIYMSGPLLTTYEPKVYKDLGDDAPFNLISSAESARDFVRKQIPHRPDFIKIWFITQAEGLTAEAGARKNLESVKAAIDEAHKSNLKVAIHATERLTAQLAVENGCDFLVHSVEDELLSDDFIKLIKSKNVIVCPTLMVHNGYANTFGQRLNASKHVIERSDPHQLGSLLDLKHLSDTAVVLSYKKRATSDAYLQHVKSGNEISLQNLKKLSDAGVTIATGTDAGNIGTLHASSYLDEVLLMRQSGMSNWKILEASTINGAKVLGKQKEFGSISKGRKANLLLLDANPIENIENITKINRVINKGVVFDPQKLLRESPEDLVQRQLNAYNFRNLEAFLDTYSDDVEIFEFPEKPLAKGKEAMRKNYGPMFEKTPTLHCEILGRIVQGNIVIDKESVWFGDEKKEAVAIYHIENGKINKVYFAQ